MAKKLILLSLLAMPFCYSQNDKPATGDSTINKWSVDFGIGLTKALYPFSPGYKTNIVDLVNVSLGGRYMFNNKFGLKLDYGYNSIRGGHGSIPFRSFYQRISIQGVANLGEVLDFHQLTNKFTIFFHGGIGMSSLKNDASKWLVGVGKNNSDDMMHFIFGLTPTWKVSERLSLNLDFTIIPNVGQNFTFDLHQGNYGHGVDGFLVNMSGGLSYYIGKGSKHMDWNLARDLDTSMNALDRRVSQLEKMMADDDKDGVGNLRDEEPATEVGAIVNSKGQTLKNMDSDGDGIADLNDKCPNEKGLFSANGCPDTDEDGVPNSIDKCPTERGEQSNLGCPYIKQHVEQMNNALRSVQFDYNKSTILACSFTALDEVATVMRTHPDYELDLVGHTDALGTNEFNQGLSLRRAEAVKKYLISKGVSAKALTEKGMGETSPITTNDTEEGRAINRRVEFQIKK